MAVLQYRDSDGKLKDFLLPSQEGKEGKSAYEVACAQGYTGTEDEWLLTLKGDKGDIGEMGIDQYSLTDVLTVGIWIDGSTIYRRMVTVTMPEHGATTYANVLLWGIQHIINMRLICWKEDSYDWIDGMFSDITNVYWISSNNRIMVENNASTDLLDGAKCYLIVDYIHT